MSVVPSWCKISPSTVALPHDHSVPCYRLGTAIYSGHPLASILHAEGQDYHSANLIRKVSIHFLSGVLLPSSEIRIHTVRHRYPAWYSREASGKERTSVPRPASGVQELPRRLGMQTNIQHLDERRSQPDSRGDNRKEIIEKGMCELSLRVVVLGGVKS